MMTEQRESILSQIEQEYERERFRNLALRNERKQEVFSKVPAYKALCEAPRSALTRLFSALEEGGVPFSKEEAKQEEARLKEEKSRLLTQNGFPADYLDEIFTCALCADTGYRKDAYGARTLRCDCFKQKLTKRLLAQSGLAGEISAADFSLVSTEYYQGEDLENFRRTLRAVREFVTNPEYGYKNFFFYGTIGTGKSYLSSCVAKEWIAMGREVLYFSSGVLFDRLADARRDGGGHLLRDSLYDCDLLILDDLGTEWFNSFVFSEVFKLVNERILRKKSTIISTNLTLQNLTEVYSERLLSRITSNYLMCKFGGPDIRMETLLKRQGKSE